MTRGRALSTRMDAAVDIAALQRVAHAPKVIHLRRLSAVICWMQRNPGSIVFRAMRGPFRILAMSDSAFKKEDDSGHAMRGSIVMLTNCVGPLETGLKDAVVHVIDYASRKQRHVTRSTFSAEILSAGDAATALSRRRQSRAGNHACHRSIRLP